MPKAAAPLCNITPKAGTKILRDSYGGRWEVDVDATGAYITEPRRIRPSYRS